MHKVIVIAGVTGSGKTTLSLALAEKIQGEIIVADSRTVYQGMDIGTAKATEGERARVPHHGLDLIRPDQSWTVYDFKVYAEKMIEEIVSRGRVPLLVGGTGLYLSALTDNYDFVTKSVGPKKYEVLVLMTAVDRETLYAWVDARVDEMLSAGFEAEARSIFDRYGAEVPSMTGIGYRHFARYFTSEIDREEAIRQMKRDSRHYAKRQWTWWRHHGLGAKVVSSSEEAISFAQAFLDENSRTAEAGASKRDKTD